mmetsp:Transcript_4353/g.7756  ORF Transcript_4353/g.7756 Transcript_4353/m.7756 type:complete len:607 (-) Transcript_4353:55-1875(-)
MRSQNIVKTAMTSVMMSCIVPSARAAFLTNRVSKMLPSYSINSLRNYELGRNNASLFCCNTKRGYIAHRAHSPRPTLILNMNSDSIAEQQSSFSSKSDGEESQTNIELSNLSEIIRESYDSGETDGVHHELSSNNILTKLSANLDAEEVANQLVGAAMEAAGKERGKLAAMINAIIASCCGGGDGDDTTKTSQSHPQISLAILDIMDEMHAMDATTMITPDIVSLSLVYYSLLDQPQQQHDTHEFESESETILERAQRLAKKTAGSQRRKAIAAERRRGSNTNGMDAKEVENQLQSLYGPDIHILHETEDVIIIAKPAGMVTYHSKKTSAGKITSSRKKKSRAANANGVDGGKDGAKRVDISLVDALLDVPFALSTLNPTARGIVHRIDRGTSGIIVLAKTDEIHLRLVALFFLRRVKKKYLALIPGCDESNGMGGGKSEDPNNNPLQLPMGSTGVIDTPVDGRPAHSTYKVVGEYGNQQQQSSSPEAVLLEVQTVTGRKHQVRVHCASLGRPIFLDPLYSSSKAEEKPKAKEKGKKKKQPSSAMNADKSTPTLPKVISDLLGDSNHDEERFFLHATSLSISELGISVTAPLPSWWIDDIHQIQSD